MEHSQASQIFTTLGHPDRLMVFRLLMRFAPQGVRPTEIAEALGFKANTLSHHLSELTATGLVTVRRQGRSLYYAVQLDTTEALIAYLAQDVARGRPDLLGGLAGAGPLPTPPRPWQVLFLCSGNRARSLMAEALLRDLGGGRFIAHSAGLHPGEAPHPTTLSILGRNGHDTRDLRSKSITEFQRPEAPQMDFVFTVCDRAATEECAPWPGLPLTAHWGLPDPVAATGTAAEQALVFARTYGALRRRIAAFAELPLASLDRLALQSRLDALGEAPPEQE